MAAYAFARIKFVGKNVVFLMILAGLMIPIQSTIVPKFIVIRQMSLINTLWALILPAIIDPLAIFLLRQFMMTIPSSYDESAYIDGAGRFAGIELKTTPASTIEILPLPICPLRTVRPKGNVI